MAFDNNDGRIRGRKRKERRERMWARNPFCAGCGKLVVLTYPHPNGFELDHKEPLKAAGGKGEDTEANCQILCSGPEGCHAKKTARDMGHRPPRRIGLDGFPVDD
ncbi:HNH endonuclease signature motif containing protein [Xenophilus sp.]|uniref:HNH endonuclease signature motif containing protein n=1 Tax=Xenophilus sp. TaxID=1873499 RepID=UPI0037DD2912